MTKEQWVDSRQGQETLLWYTQTDSGAYIAYLIVNGDFFLDLKEAKVCSQPLSPGTEVVSAWSYTFFASWHTQEQLYLSNTVIPDLHHLTLCSTIMCLSQDPIYSIKPSTHIWTHNAEVFFELLNNHDKDLTLKHLVEIQKQSTLEEAVKPELEPKERTMTLLNVTEVPGLKVGIKVSENIDSHKQQQLDKDWWVSLLAMRKFWRRRRGFYLTREQCLVSSSHLQGLLHHQLYCWTLEMMILMTHLQFKRKCLFLNLWSVFISYILSWAK